LGIPIAVISNGSLLWRPEVRAALAEADWVSVKVDTVTDDIWRRVDHPQSDLEISQVLDGIRRFADGFNGDLCAEIMLVSRVNDAPESLSAVAEYLSELDIETAYLAVPTRPPAFPGVKPPGEWVLNQAYHLLARHLPRVEYLIGYEGDAFAATGEIATDVLSITAVHPLRSSAIEEMLARSGTAWDVIEALVSDGQLKRVDYQGERYYLRSYPPGDA
jgi:wyosine [tRNA(Phe)-imidazoG37] synthetase (radical SAM superfamily)